MRNRLKFTPSAPRAIHPGRVEGRQKCSQLAGGNLHVIGTTDPALDVALLPYLAKLSASLGEATVTVDLGRAMVRIVSWLAPQVRFASAPPKSSRVLELSSLPEALPGATNLRVEDNDLLRLRRAPSCTAFDLAVKTFSQGRPRIGLFFPSDEPVLPAIDAIKRDSQGAAWITYDALRYHTGRTLPLRDLLDEAGLYQCLDLIVTSDPCIAFLGALLDKQVWWVTDTASALTYQNFVSHHYSAIRIVAPPYDHLADLALAVQGLCVCTRSHSTSDPLSWLAGVMATTAKLQR